MSTARMENVNNQYDSVPYGSSTGGTARMENVNNQYDSASYGSSTGGTNFNDGNTTLNSQAAKDQAASLAQAAQNTAANAYNSAANTQFAQDLANGPAAQSVKNQANATGNEFSDLASSRKMPEHKAANDTPLTHYHSFFFNLLSWKNPRATGITFGAFVAFIFACRYLPIIRLSLKGTWTILGVVTLAEAAAKFTIGSSVAGSVRPRRYYKIPKETLEATLDDVEQLINFFVIEAQRIVFAEHIPNTALAFAASFASYYLVKLLPAWGFALFATCVTFLVPLVYTQNKELIDAQYENVSNIAVQQSQQLRDLTVQNTSKAAETVKAYTGEYANVASEYIGKSRQKIPSVATNGTTSGNTSSNTAGVTTGSTTGTTTGTTTGSTRNVSDTFNSGVNDADFPRAPANEFASFAEHQKPILTAPGDREPFAASAI